MKKILIFTFVLVMCLCLVACGAEKNKGVKPVDNSALEGLATPVEKLKSLDELNKKMGSRLVKPEGDNVEDVHYQVFYGPDYNIGEYAFKINGVECSVRVAATAKDISGVYTKTGSIFTGENLNATVLVYNGSKYYRWFNTDGQYILAVGKEDGNEDLKDFFVEKTATGITKEKAAALYKEIAGNYEDSVGKRATAEVTNNDGENATIIVRWSSSVNEYACWVMNVRVGEDGLLSYYDCRKNNVVIKEDGTEKATIEYENKTGYFSWNAEKKELSWNGASEIACAECVFTHAE